MRSRYPPRLLFVDSTDATRQFAIAAIAADIAVDAGAGGGRRPGWGPALAPPADGAHGMARGKGRAGWLTSFAAGDGVWLLSSRSPPGTIARGFRGRGRWADGR